MTRLHKAKFALRDRWRPAGWHIDLHRTLPDGQTIDLVVSSLESSTAIDLYSGSILAEGHRGPNGHLCTISPEGHLHKIREKGGALRRHHMRIDATKAPTCHKALVVASDVHPHDQLWQFENIHNRLETLDFILDKMNLRPPPTLDGHSTTPGLAMGHFRSTLDGLGTLDAVSIIDGSQDDMWLTGRLEIEGDVDRKIYRDIDLSSRRSLVRRFLTPRKVSAIVTRRDGTWGKTYLNGRTKLKMHLEDGTTEAFELLESKWIEFGSC